MLLAATQLASSMQVFVSAGKGVVYQNYENRINWLVMFEDMDVNSEISVVLSEDSVTASWFKYSGEALVAGQYQKVKPTFISNQAAIYPDDHTGYLLRLTGIVDGKAYNREMSVWVINYKNYLFPGLSLIPEDPANSVCEELKLTLNGTIPVMKYMLPTGQSYNIPRNFNVKYNTKEWADEWKTVEITEPADLIGNILTIKNPPYTDTYFTLFGDQFAADLNMAIPEIKSTYYGAIRVISKIKTEATLRTEKHEGDRPDLITVLSGSAPLEINFTAISNTPVADFLNWGIYSGNDLIISRTDESHRYTFSTSGKYTVKLTTQNAYCSHVDSVIVNVSESAIYAPNVFTPNGDGLNDEFRVAYKSIVEFKATIYNRWGSRLFEWTDPQKGWNGTTHGKPVAEGAYFFVISAKGSDGEEYLLKGDINLLRGKK